MVLLLWQLEVGLKVINSVSLQNGYVVLRLQNTWNSSSCPMECWDQVGWAWLRGDIHGNSLDSFAALFSITRCSWVDMGVKHVCNLCSSVGSLRDPSKQCPFSKGSSYVVAFIADASAYVRHQKSAGRGLFSGICEKIAKMMCIIINQHVLTGDYPQSNLTTTGAGRVQCWRSAEDSPNCTISWRTSTLATASIIEMRAPTLVVFRKYGVTRGLRCHCL